jgi:hypothetical protein
MAEVVNEAMEEVGADVVRDVKDVLAADAAARTVATETARRLEETRVGATR